MKGTKSELWYRRQLRQTAPGDDLEDEVRPGFVPDQSARTIAVRINDKTYDKRVATLVRWSGELHASIPFDHRIRSGPDAHVLGGSRCKGQLTVETVIEFDVGVDRAVELLRAAGFLECREEFIV